VEKTGITAVILAKNEEKNLPQCLESVAWVDEVIVVDDQSTDKSVSLAKKAGAKVYHRKLDDFALQRNFALSKVKTEWVLLIDPDESVPSKLKEEILQAKKLKDFAGFYFPRKNIIFGQWIKHSGWSPDYQLHFFRMKKGKYVGKVHERVEVEGKVGYLKTSLIHENFQSISQYLEKLIHYTQLEAEKQVKSGYQFSWSDLIQKPLDEFLRRFFAEKGYQDGIHGLALCLLQAFSELMVYLRVWEEEGFPTGPTKNVFSELEKAIGQLQYWLVKQSKNPIKKLLGKLK
jgi:glycosyltransferase involved in cell wall biosynthesis